MRPHSVVWPACRLAADSLYIYLETYETHALKYALKDLLGGWRFVLHAGAAVTRREVPRTRCLMLLAQVLRLRLKRDHLSRIAALQVSVFVRLY